MWTIEKARGRQAESGRERGDDGRAFKHCFKNLISGIPAPGIPSDWLLLTVHVNILSVCLKRSDISHGERDTRA